MIVFMLPFELIVSVARLSSCKFVSVGECLPVMCEAESVVAIGVNCLPPYLVAPIIKVSTPVDSPAIQLLEELHPWMGPESAAQILSSVGNSSSTTSP